MSYNYIQAADTVLNGMHDYVIGFTVYHSDLIYNFYKEKVFTLSYEQILDKLSALYKIPRHYFQTEKLNKALMIWHQKYKEYEKYYMEQRDLATDLSRVRLEEIDKMIPLNLERYSASILTHIIDIKNGFNLVNVVNEQQAYFRKHNQYKVIEPTKIPETPIEAKTEVTMNISSHPDGVNVKVDTPKITPQEFMMHLTNLQNLANEYFDKNFKPNTRYELEMKLTFPQ